MNGFLSRNIFPVITIYIYLIDRASLISSSFKQQICWWDFASAVRKCRPPCNEGYFSLHGMPACHPWLTCEDISDVTSGSTLGAGAVKMAILGSWQGYPVVINKLRSERYKDDFMHGLDMVQFFQPNPRIVQLVGFCRQKNIYLTEYHHLGSANQLEAILNFQESSLNQKCHGDNFDIQQTDTIRHPMKYFYDTTSESLNNNLINTNLPSVSSVCSVCESPEITWMGWSKKCSDWMNSEYNLKAKNEDNILITDRSKMNLNVKQILNANSLSTRFQLCLDYITILSLIHNNPGGTRIMCDSNDVHKTLSQYLLTDDLRLVVNDLDALPYVNSDDGITAKCGHHELTGEFVAPEQLWPFEDREFNDDDMPGYDEKTDIWKIPQICDTFIGTVPGGTTLKLHLFNINAKCKNDDPKQRPSSEEVFEEYDKIWRKLNKNL